MGQPELASGKVGRSRIVAWALWDCGSTGLNAIVATFVFSVYLTSSVGVGISGSTTPASWLGRAGALAGLTVALLAPLVGVWVESPHRRRVALSVLTCLAVALTCAMFFIHDRPGYLWAGLVLLGATAACGIFCGGSPALPANSANRSGVSDARSDGFATTVLPAARAGASFFRKISRG